MSEQAEFPKMLFLDGEPRTEDGRPVRHERTRVVADAEEEAEARAEGFKGAHEPDEGAEPKPAKGKKAPKA